MAKNMLYLFNNERDIMAKTKICSTIRELQVTLDHCIYERGGEEFVCNLCGETFEFYDEALLHVLNDHNPDMTIPDVNPNKIF